MRNLFLALALLVSLVGYIFAEPTIFLVRHAEKASTGDPKDPDLSGAGRQRAESLAAMLKDAGITAIYATDLKRSQQTTEPLAKAASVEPTIVPAKDTAALVAKLKEAKSNVLVVGHSNTLPEILKTLGVESPPAIDEADYDNLFVLTPGSPTQLLRLHFR
ncbi:MAG: phosphoglycerate mutase family protein [Chthoniobacterales bacterium]